MVSEEGLEAIIGLSIAGAGIIGMAVSGWSMYNHSQETIVPAPQTHQIQVDTQENRGNDYNWKLAGGIFAVSTLALFGGLYFACPEEGM